MRFGNEQEVGCCFAFVFLSRCLFVLSVRVVVLLSVSCCKCVLVSVCECSVVYLGRLVVCKEGRAREGAQSAFLMVWGGAQFFCKHKQHYFVDRCVLSSFALL